MQIVLRCIIADLEPTRFLGHELVETYLQPRIVIETVGRDRKHVLIRENLAKGRSAMPAEVPIVFVRRDCFVRGDAIGAGQ